MKNVAIFLTFFIILVPIVDAVPLVEIFVDENTPSNQNIPEVIVSSVENGDLELLGSTSYKVTEVIRAPAGSRVEKIALQPMTVDMPGYVRKTLPDGRIALVPVAVNQDIKSVHSSMHTNQQPPNQ